MARVRKASVWQYSNRQNNDKRESKLEAYWEVDLDSISDHYDPKEINAQKLFLLWTKKVIKKHTNSLIPIYWFVKDANEGIIERMPFQFEHKHFQNTVGDENFLTFFTWPVNKETNDYLNWLKLPVANKHWKQKNADKGGFIQQATGWKPSILQPYIYLPALASALLDQDRV